MVPLSDRVPDPAALEMLLAIAHGQPERRAQSPGVILFFAMIPLRVLFGRYGSGRETQGVAVDVDSQTMADVIKRLRRAQGQVGGVIRMIEEGRDCADVVTQLAAASRALDRAGFKIIASGLKQCVREEQEGDGTADSNRAQLERLFLSLA